MDRSLDSIGSCSLDVDADSSDISDTSGSLNFPTPISVKDVTREFTANIKERCTLQHQQQQQQPQLQRTITTAAYINLDQCTGAVRMVLSPPAASDLVDDSQQQQQLQQPHHTNGGESLVVVDAVEKKPSYLNLACCVNGYSNLTTYDSKIRQDINKSREVSPIRPSTSSLQYCKRNNSLAAPVLHTMPLTKQPATAGMASKYTSLNNETNNNSNNNNNNNSSNNNNINSKNSQLMENGDHGYCNGSGAVASQGSSPSSFIQQRVERLYGPGALAQGFYSPKKQSSGSRYQLQQTQQQYSYLDAPQSTELSRKFKQLSPSKDYGEFRKKLQSNCSHTARSQSEQPTAKHNGDVDLPVFRHLSYEFRAQLPSVSPKRSVQRISPAPEVLLPPTNGAASVADVVDHVQPPSCEEYLSTTKISAHADLAKSIEAEAAPVVSSETGAVVKDGNYFLKVLKDEQVRLLALAAVAEKYIDALTNNPNITEDTFGLLRSAAGKARLLSSQKMKQFEGLCHNNLNRSPEDAFPTTIDDLQGFWDMVYLQVTHVDSIFSDIEQLKRNNWQRTNEPEPEPIKTTKTAAKLSNPKAKTASAAAATKTAASTSNVAAAMKREAQRKRLLEMKRQRREALAAAAKNQSDCDDVGSIGDTVNIAVKNSS